MKQDIRILIADDHPFFTEGVSNALRPYTRYKIVSIVHHGSEVMDQVTQHQPDLILLDVNLPGKDGISLSREIRKTWPLIRIILLTMYMPSDIHLNTDSDLVDGYILKNSGTNVLLFGLSEIENGRKFNDPSINKESQHSSDSFSNRLKLSSREKEILQLLVSGNSNKEIAAHLFLSELTIKTHRKNLMAKLGAHNLADLVKKSN